MILVVVGTHEDPFDRLCAAAEVLAGSEPVVLQKGTSTLPTPRCQATPMLPPRALAAHLREARLVVCHAGPATLVEAGEAGHVPIVVPRSAAHGEHVDDHQVAFARRIRDRIHLVEDPAGLPGAVARHHEVVVGRRPLGADPARSRAFAADLEELCLRLCEDRPPRRRRRDRFRALHRWMSRRP